MAMAFATILDTQIIRSIARKVDASRYGATVVGPVALLAFGNLPMGLWVPEYIAFLLLITGIWILVAAPASWPRSLRLFLWGFLVACACATSLRLGLFGVAGLLVVFLEPGRLPRLRAVLWVLSGMIAGILPSALQILTKQSPAEVFYWHYTFFQKM
jgi:hypothetical protein